MMERELFFELEDTGLDTLIPPGEPVWKALDTLQAYLAGLFQGSSWPLAGMTGQIDRPLAVTDREVLDGVELRTGGGNAPQVFSRGGALLERVALIMPGAHLYDDRILLGPGSVVEPGALIKGPAVFGCDCEIRQGAYVRGDCWVGDGCVVGHATEIKGSIFLPGAKAGHFAYVGDSILGRNVNLGAGTKLANLKMISGTITISDGRERYDTGRRKIGAILGDRTETGCNSVTSPGTLMGPRCIVYPGLTVPGGYYPRKSIILPAKGSLKILTPHR